MNGAFHSDFGAGTAERTRRRLAGKTVTIVSILPVSDLDTLAPAGDDLKRADFLVYTVKGSAGSGRVAVRPTRSAFFVGRGAPPPSRGAPPPREAGLRPVAADRFL